MNTQYMQTTVSKCQCKKKIVAVRKANKERKTRFYQILNVNFVELAIEINVFILIILLFVMIM
jgi:hypothetical protein